MRWSDKSDELLDQLSTARFDDDREAEKALNILNFVNFDGWSRKPDLCVFSEKSFVAFFNVQGGYDSAQIIIKSRLFDVSDFDTAIFHIGTVSELPDIFKFNRDLDMIGGLGRIQ